MKENVTTKFNENSIHMGLELFYLISKREWISKFECVFEIILVQNDELIEKGIQILSSISTRSIVEYFQSTSSESLWIPLTIVRISGFIGWYMKKSYLKEIYYWRTREGFFFLNRVSFVSDEYKMMNFLLTGEKYEN